MHLTLERVKQFNNIYKQIAEYYGPSIHYSEELPQLMLIYDERDYDYGYFEYPYVIVNVARCNRVSRIIRTMIHEYIHYCQSPTWYTRYSKMYAYWDQPYEVEARAIAERDWRMFKPDNKNK